MKIKAALFCAMFWWCLDVTNKYLKT